MIINIADDVNLNKIMYFETNLMIIELITQSIWENVLFLI